MPRKKIPAGEAFDRNVAAIPGYGVVEFTDMQADTFDGDPAEELDATSRRLVEALRARHVVAVLAKTGEQLLREMVPGTIGPGASQLEQVHVELLQAFALSAGTGRAVPASPNSTVRLWTLLRSNLGAYLASTDPGPDADADAVLSRRVRTRTIFYRNFLSGGDAMDVVPSLLQHMDDASERGLGYRLSDVARAMFALFAEIGKRFDDRIERETRLFEQDGGDAAVAEAVTGDVWGERLWRPVAHCPLPPEGRAWAGFQVAEMLCASLFTFTRVDLEARFGVVVAEALFACSLELGSLSRDELSGIYLGNPVWERPFIRLDQDRLFLPLPALMVSFPFTMVERLMGDDAKLDRAYAQARAHYLERDVERIVRKSLPSARVHVGVKWTDPDSGRTYEHDVVAIAGMHVLIFEAKSGKLPPAARRGAPLRLRSSFRKLFVEPGIQASRLEALLAGRRHDVALVDKDGVTVEIETAGPSVVQKFGICIEQFSSVTSSRRLFREMGLLSEDQDWAPILTLGELRMISDRLDTEISFLHYLTRRMSADDVFDFVGDEQDLLSMYLTNGFGLDSSGLEGRQVSFFQADAAVRGHPTPRADRGEFETHGVRLPPLWHLIGKEVYTASDRHRFDILITLLNQNSGALAGMGKHIQRWRAGGGVGKGSTISSRSAIGDRVFVVAVHMAKEWPFDETEWIQQARFIASELAANLGATDCVVLLKTRRSKSPTFDAISFFRFPR